MKSDKMNISYCPNWEKTKKRFAAWWGHEKIDVPLMRIVAAGKIADNFLPVEGFHNVEEIYLDAVKITRNYENYCRTHYFLEDAFPSVSLDIGPGSMALYLGAEPRFSENTCWFKACVDDWDTWGDLIFNPDNYWWKTHVDMIKTAKETANGNFLVNIPDIVENLDILSAMRGSQNLCYDLMDKPDAIGKLVEQVDDLYFRYYDAMYDIVKGPDSSSSYTAFMIWGPGRTAKIQCDFCALISPEQFRKNVLPSLRKQCRRLDNSIYHLDGPDAIKHVPALMEIEELNALQWTCGAGQPDGGNERWYPIYDQVRAAGKSLWVHFYDGGSKDWIESCRQLIQRYGPDCFYFIFPDFKDKETAMEAAAAIRDMCKRKV